MKKTLGALLAAVMILSMCFGMLPAALAEDAPLEFTFMGRTRPPYDAEQMVIWDELMARTNTKINFMWVPQENYTEKINSVLASGDIPEIIFEPNIALMLDQGAIIPLDDLYENNMPNVTSKLAEEDYLYLRQAMDGQIYHLPYLLDFPPSMTWTIRKDWADAAGMDLPTNWDEWMAYWIMVRDTDCNGDGDASNEIPLVVSSPGELYEMGTAFGIKTNNGYFASYDDGELVPLFEHVNFRTYLEALVTLYAEDILDKEFVTRGTDYKTILDKGLAGSSYYFAERCKLTTDILRETDANAKWYPLAPAMDAEGNQAIKARAKVQTTGAVWTVTAEEKGTAAAIADFYNYVFGEEGSDLLNYGIVGEHCEIVDGQYKINDEITEGGFNAARAAGIVPTITPMDFLADAYLQILMGGKSYEELPESTQYFYDGLFLNEPYFYKQVPIYTTEAYVEYQASLGDRLTEIFVKCITGELSVDQFYDEYEKIKGAGWATVIEEQIEAYNTVAGR